MFLARSLSCESRQGRNAGKRRIKAILNMDREISKEVQRKEQRKQFIRIGTAVGGFIVLIVVVISMLQTSLKRKDLNISTVDKGVIEVSVSASGKVIPAFEEIINSPINTRIVEIYKKGGDSVDIGTPILKLDLQSVETDYKKLLDEEQMRSYKLNQLRVNNQTKLNDLAMKIKVSAMQLNRKKVELRNEQYLDSLGSGTTDKVRQAELSYNVARSTRRAPPPRRGRSTRSSTATSSRPPRSSSPSCQASGRCRSIATPATLSLSTGSTLR